jgi:hypothetical protein
VPLSELTADNTEVRGFNGRPSATCGFSLPIICHLPTRLYCALSVTRKPGLVWTTEEEIRELQAAGRVTLFRATKRLDYHATNSIQPRADELTWSPEAMQLPKGWNTTNERKQPAILWFHEAILLALSTFLDWLFSGGVPELHRSDAYGEASQKRDHLESLFACCAAADWVEAKLNTWGWSAKERFDTELSREAPTWGRLLDLADDGLCAARDGGLRYWLYVRYCAALYYRPNAGPERAYQTYRVFIQTAYPGVPWDRVCEEMFVVVRRAQDVRRLATLERLALARPVP